MSSVLEQYAGPSSFATHGERVVVGQRLMQAAGDVFLGWTVGLARHRDFYIRQLRDMKVSMAVEMMGAAVCIAVIQRRLAPLSTASVAP